jgi:hypothetical protein
MARHVPKKGVLGGNDRQSCDKFSKYDDISRRYEKPVSAALRVKAREKEGFSRVGVRSDAWHGKCNLRSIEQSSITTVDTSELQFLSRNEIEDLPMNCDVCKDHFKRPSIANQ